MKSISKSSEEPHHTLAGHSSAPAYIDQATKNKIQRHLTDINDRITEEDIKNIDTNITSSTLVKSPLTAD